MKRFDSQYALAPPLRRLLKIFAADPMLGRTAGNRITIDIPNEPLAAGPQGSRLEVIDYDGAHDCYYAPVNLDDRAILMQNGLEPTESDPRFHQQMVYAVAMKAVENFERALGRRVHFRRRSHPRLRLFPHAFHGANAYYDRARNCIFFGYFRADKDDPGPNLPGQNVFTCLSHDIIVHEMTHALVDRLRRYFLEPSNEDVLAFHEGFSDIVALFQHFSFQDLLRSEIQRRRADLRGKSLLVELAQQFGYATGEGRSLRSALDKPDARLYQSVTEAHERGSILVAAVFDAYFTVYQRRIRDLIRIATGGTGNLPDADLHPDLVNRVSAEAARTAQSILTMGIRAFDYLPPVDITFGDYLRALVTADYELQPVDEFGQRAAMIEAFRLRGIYPENVASLAEESLLWENATGLPPLPGKLLESLTLAAQRVGRRPSEKDFEESPGGEIETEEDLDLRSEIAHLLHQYAIQNADDLALDQHPTRQIEVHGFHQIYRVASDGQLRIELVAQFTQKDRDKSRREELGGIPFRGGTTIVASADGTVRYMISKPLTSAAKISPQKQREAEQRLERQRRYVAVCDATDPNLAWCDSGYFAQRMALRMNLAALHQGVIR